MAKIKTPQNIKYNPIEGRLKEDFIKRNKITDDKIMFSFLLLDNTHDYFGLDWTCENWSELLFERMKLLSDMNKGELFSGRYKTLRVHKHDSQKANFMPPKDIMSDDFVQIRLEKGNGGMHGIFIENVFYIVWFDPQHNMYDSEGYGQAVKVKTPNSCCKYRDEELVKLKKENEELTKLLDVETS